MTPTSPAIRTSRSSPTDSPPPPRAGIEVHTLVRDSLATSPLPDELRAAALWWRLSGLLSVAALDGDPTLWTPGQLLGTAYEFLHGGIDPVDHGVTFPAHELATALTWRAEMLVRENHLARTYTPPTVEPLSIEDEEALAPLDETIGDTTADVLPAEFANPDNLPAPVNAPTAAVDAAAPTIPLASDAD
ncbi:hypothetical protein [Rhodococcus sp. 077-4]|uniref:hypothetical protein n=1 Tax=Rhodococcus sp. 077-4 TaxID=2789271 RepID=UPI0039F56105